MNDRSTIIEAPLARWASRIALFSGSLVVVGVVLHRLTTFPTPVVLNLFAVALAGGFTEYAKRDKIIVLRSGPDGSQKKMKLDVERLIKTSTGDLFYVLPYDKIYVQ